MKRKKLTLDDIEIMQEIVNQLSDADRAGIIEECKKRIRSNCETDNSSEDQVTENMIYLKIIQRLQSF